MLLATIANARQTTPCVEIYPELAVWGKGLYKRGEPVEPSAWAENGLTALKLKPGTKVTKLGKGSTAVVFRITPPGGSTYLFKRYVTTEFTPTTAELSQKYQRDLAHLELFANASKHDATETLEVIKVKKKDDGALTVKLNDFKGFALIDLLDFMKEQDTAKYDALVAQYNKRVDVFVGDLRAAGMKVEPAGKELNHPNLRAYHTTLPSEPGSLDVAGHANTIYDPQTGRFMIVDPL